MKKIVIVSLFITTACAGLPQGPKNNCSRIETGPGPEDFVADPLSNSIFISSHNRRNWGRGEIYVYKGGNKSEIIPRTGVWNGNFAPHGMDIHVSKRLLYVISHGKTELSPDHRILVYRIRPDRLEFAGEIKNQPALVSPNDIAVAENGVYISNDAGARGSKWEMISGKKSASVVYCSLGPDLLPDKNTACKTVARDLGMANGVLTDSKHLYVATSRENILYKYDLAKNGELSGKTAIMTEPGQDNLFWSDQKQDSMLLAAHYSMTSFLLHMLYGMKSPSVIVNYRINENRKTVIYAGDGSEISAASGGMYFRDRLYISQVFENFILVCEK